MRTMQTDNVGYWLLLATILLCVWHIWGWFPLFYTCIALHLLGVIGLARREGYEINAFLREHQLTAKDWRVKS